MAEVTIKAGDGGQFSAYLAEPKGSAPAPGLVLIQEIFGVNQVMRDLADGFAAQGYLTLCPDLFWRQEPGIQLTDKTDAEWGRAFQLYQGFNEAKGVEDLIAALGALRAHPRSSGQVGSLGYCLGGKLAYLMATRSDADCSVGYYGVAIEKALDEAPAITKPLLLHIAGSDQYCPPEAQAKITEAMAGVPTATAYVYPGMDHAFARVGGAHYDQAAADLANQRSAEFLKLHLA